MTTSGQPACGNLAGHPFRVNAKMITNRPKSACTCACLCMPKAHAWGPMLSAEWQFPYSTKCKLIYNIICTSILYYCSILHYYPVIEILNLVIYDNHWTLGVTLHCVKCSTAVSSINGEHLVQYWVPTITKTPIMNAKFVLYESYILCQYTHQFNL